MKKWQPKMVRGISSTFIWLNQQNQLKTPDSETKSDKTILNQQRPAIQFWAGLRWFFQQGLLYTLLLV